MPSPATIPFAIAMLFGADAAHAALCTVGNWSATGSDPCTPATQGHYVGTVGATAETACDPGTYQNQSGQSSCIAAPAGFFVPGSGASFQTICAAGSYQPLTGQTSCLPASVGRFVAVAGATAQQNCAVGQYQPLSGQTSCNLAPVGSFVSVIGASSAAQCPAGMFQSTAGQSACNVAPAGSYVSVVGASSATLCAAGTFQPFTGQSTPTACTAVPAGSYAASAGSSSATACALGSFQPLSGQTSCNLAAAGSFVNITGATAASACAIGAFQSTAGQSACNLAAAGSFVNITGATAASACAIGAFQSTAGQSACNLAPAGSFVGATGQIAATLCVPGRYQPGVGQSACLVASAGYFVPVSGATSQTACPVGSSSSAGAVQCSIVDQLADSDGDGIPNGTELAEGRDPFVKDNDVFSPGSASARLFAMQQYRDFLGREGDPAGITGWSGIVDAGTYSRGQVIDAFLSSQEFAGSVAPVVRLYFATFLRIPDYAGMTYNAGLVRNGTVTMQQLADYFTTSPEFTAAYGALDNTAFVTLLYTNVLGRAPDSGGLAAWVSLLEGGTTRGQVLLGFSDSGEYQAAMANEVFTTMMYAGMLRRTPDQAGFNSWVSALDASAITHEQVIGGFFLSSEYHGRFLP